MSAARTLYLGYFSRTHAAEDPSVASLWDDVRGRRVSLTAVFATEQEAAGYRYKDKVCLGQVIACVQPGGQTMVAPNRTRPLQGPGNAARRY